MTSAHGWRARRSVPTDEPEKIFQGRKTCGTRRKRRPGPEASLAWVNSPSNPTGRMPRPGRLRELAAWARQSGPCSPATSATSTWHSTPTRCRSLHPARLRAVPRRPARRSTPSPSAPTWPATGPASSPVTPAWSPNCLRLRKHAGMIVPAPGPGRDDGGIGSTTTTPASSTPGTRGAATSCCAPRSRRRAGWSATPKPDCTCGPVTRTRTAGSRSATSRDRHPGLARRLLRHGGQPARPSRPHRRPTNGSAPPPPGWPSWPA